MVGSSFTLFTAPVLVVRQRDEGGTLRAEHAVLDDDGRFVGSVREVDRNQVAQPMKPRHGSGGTVRLQVVDAAGQVLLSITRPPVAVRSVATVARPDGSSVGRIVQRSLGMFGKLRFDLEADGQALGSFHAASWGDRDYTVRDADGVEAARITSTWPWSGGSSEPFTSADAYVVQILRPSADPLRTLVVAAALTVDTFLLQKSGERRRWTARR